MDQAQSIGPNELAELRGRIKALETELQQEREKKKDTKEKERESLSDNLEKTWDEFNKLSRGFFFAGLESLSVAADVTKTFVDKTTQRNDKRETLTGTMTNLPVDVTEGFLDAMDQSIDKTGKIVDRFYEKYKEKKEK